MAILHRLLKGATLVLVGVLSFVAGRITAPAPGLDVVLREVALLRQKIEEQGASLPPPPQCALAASTSTAVDMASLRAELAQVLRTELEMREGVATKPEAQEPQPPSPQAVAAQQESLRLLKDATHSRQWREQDALAVRQLLAQMTDSQRQEVMNRISATLNGGGIDVQAHGPPF